MDTGATDLEYYVQESAHILGLPEHAHDAKVTRLCIYRYMHAFDAGLVPCMMPSPFTADISREHTAKQCHSKAAKLSAML